MLILENALDDWLRVAKSTESTDELFVSTPYVTGDVLDSVFDNSSSEKKFLLTELKLQNVFTGSFDLGVLENLLSKDVKIFHLRGLHAKVLVSSQGLVLGSQNFTFAGIARTKFNFCSLLTHTTYSPCTTSSKYSGQNLMLRLFLIGHELLTSDFTLSAWITKFRN